jgi:hypothetical protein
MVFNFGTVEQVAQGGLLFVLRTDSDSDGDSNSDSNAHTDTPGESDSDGDSNPHSDSDGDSDSDSGDDTATVERVSNWGADAGDVSVAGVVFCEVYGDEYIIEIFDFEVRHTVSGLNGTFTDICDENGDLVQYYCDIYREWDLNYLGGYQTGDVVSGIMDCDGTCQDGVCTSLCPRIDDTARYLDIKDDAAVLENETMGHVYKCVLISDFNNDDYDCLSDPAVGSTAVIESVGWSERLCVGDRIFTFGVAHRCTYECQMAGGV